MDLPIKMFQDNDTAHEVTERCDFCGTEHKLRVSSKQHEAGIVEIEIESIHGALTLYSPQDVQ